MKTENDFFEEEDFLNSNEEVINNKIQENIKVKEPDVIDELEQVAQAPKKRGRGRPRKTPVSEEMANEDLSTTKTKERIKKNIEKEEVTTLPGFDEDDDFEDFATLQAQI